MPSCCRTGRSCCHEIEAADSRGFVCCWRPCSTPSGVDPNARGRYVLRPLTRGQVQEQTSSVKRSKTANASANRLFLDTLGTLPKTIPGEPCYVTTNRLPPLPHSWYPAPGPHLVNLHPHRPRYRVGIRNRQNMMTNAADLSDRRMSGSVRGARSWRISRSWNKIEFQLCLERHLNMWMKPYRAGSSQRRQQRQRALDYSLGFILDTQRSQNRLTSPSQGAIRTPGEERSVSNRRCGANRNRASCGATLECRGHSLHSKGLRRSEGAVGSHWPKERQQ